MLQWFHQNLGTIVIGLAVLAVVAFIVWKMAKDKKNGRSSCGCGCANCAMRGQCHKAQ